jgi:hypothetical protein
MGASYCQHGRIKPLAPPFRLLNTKKPPIHLDLDGLKCVSFFLSSTGRNPSPAYYLLGSIPPSKIKKAPTKTVVSALMQ